MCKFNILGVCAKGPQCPFAHSAAELCPLPDLRCTKVCKVLIATGVCNVEGCTYAHRKEELRYTVDSETKYSRPLPTHGDQWWDQQQGDQQRQCSWWDQQQPRPPAPMPSSAPWPVGLCTTPVPEGVPLGTCFARLPDLEEELGTVDSRRPKVADNLGSPAFLPVPAMEPAGWPLPWEDLILPLPDPAAESACALPNHNLGKCRPPPGLESLVPPHSGTCGFDFQRESIVVDQKDGLLKIGLPSCSDQKYDALQPCGLTSTCMRPLRSVRTSESTLCSLTDEI